MVFPGIAALRKFEQQAREVIRERDSFPLWKVIRHLLDQARFTPMRGYSLLTPFDLPTPAAHEYAVVRIYSGI
ncbi:hypothetical protein DL89DRAFT_266316 [Linderina pennispora]|uniref:Uncharacterized protein n=1 Tax=Linderina pennispora TaxID=61395 RepID=A0A1Y1WCX0_9FUNG|nr:uncharacterized protein DL89DRAFT_266316 [Linderina pennispora]ORX71292.1 hypothetical protein DL89DRAFT_266316 [Linderina pennispora]